MDKMGIFDEFLDGTDVEVVYKSLYIALKNAFDFGVSCGKEEMREEMEALAKGQKPKKEPSNVISFKNLR